MFAVSMCSSHLTCFYRTVFAAKVWWGERERESIGTSAFCVSWVLRHLLLYSQLRRFKQTVFVLVHTKEGTSAGVCVFVCPNRHC